MKPRITRDIERLQVTDRGHAYLNGLTLIPAWITNHMLSSVLDEISYPSLIVVMYMAVCFDINGLARNCGSSSANAM